MSKTEWLESLKPGDKVVIDGNHGQSVATVERVTQTQIIAANERRYRKKDGMKMGRSGWDFEHLAPATDELVAKILLSESQRRVAYRIERRYRSLTQEQCDIILAMEIPE